MCLATFGGHFRAISRPQSKLIPRACFRAAGAKIACRSAASYMCFEAPTVPRRFLE